VAVRSGTETPDLPGDADALLADEVLPERPLRQWIARAETTLAGQEDVFERPVNGAQFGARQLLSARITLRGSWDLTLWGSNLTDERYVRTAASRGSNYYPTLPRAARRRDLCHARPLAPPHRTRRVTRSNAPPPLPYDACPVPLWLPPLVEPDPLPPEEDEPLPDEPGLELPGVLG
jgi:hypothetical protein